MSGAITLRKLTRLSSMKFGQYKDLRVQELLDLKRYRYLRWCYYCCSGITFTEDILEEIGIIKFIDKPGKDETFFEEECRIKDSNQENLTGVTKIIYQRKVNKIVKGKMANLTNNQNANPSRKSMQWKNHGHK